MKFKTQLCIFFLLILMISCNNNKDSRVCNVENPLEELVFLKEAVNTINVIDCAGKSCITQYFYNSETVFEVNICGQIIVYNCYGKVICSLEEKSCFDFDRLRKNKIILYGG